MSNENTTVNAEAIEVTQADVIAEPSQDEMMALIAKLRAENAALKVKADKPLGLKVSEKGAVSLYGLGRFPVTLYKEQWLRLLAKADEVRAFIEANDAKLSVKGTPAAQ